MMIQYKAKDQAVHANRQIIIAQGLLQKKLLCQYYANNKQGLTDWLINTHASGTRPEHKQIYTIPYSLHEFPEAAQGRLVNPYEFAEASPI